MIQKRFLTTFIILLFIIPAVSDVVPPCLVPFNEYNLYHGPMDSGDEMSVFYPAGAYDLWYAELPITFYNSKEADYHNWNWQKIPDVEIKGQKGDKCVPWSYRKYIRT